MSPRPNLGGAYPATGVRPARPSGTALFNCHAGPSWPLGGKTQTTSSREPPGVPVSPPGSWNSGGASVGPSRALGTFEARGTCEALGQGPAVRQPRSLTLLGPLAGPTRAPRQLREPALARAGPLHPAAPRTALPSPCWLMPPQGSAVKELPTHTAHPPGSGPPLPCPLLVSSVPAMHTGPSIIHRTQLGAPRPWDTTQELGALCPPLVLGAGGSAGALVPLRPAHLAPGASTAQTSVTGTRKETLWRQGSPSLACGPRCLVQPPGGDRHRAPAERRWGVLRGCRGV